MQKIFNKDGFNWWIGVVEDRHDPEMLGRCRVRIFGYHTDSKLLLPTKDLPWCVPIQPITSAAISGLGSSPLGPIEGTWVIGFFLDGEDCQQPAMFGSISTKAASESFTSKNAVAKPKPDISNIRDGKLKDTEGNEVKDSADNPVKYITPKVEGWILGQTSKKYESGKGGPGTINDYLGKSAGDLGGASYGTYQFASYQPPMMPDHKARPSSKGSPVLQFIRNSKFKDRFVDLTPGTPEFDDKWQVVDAVDTVGFGEDQHDYIKRKYYNVMIANLMRAGYDMTQYGPGVQDLIWSSAVQLGPENVSVFTVPLRGKSEMTDEDIVTLVSDYKIAKVDDLFRSSSDRIREGVKKRYAKEKDDLLALTSPQTPKVLTT